MEKLLDKLPVPPSMFPLCITVAIIAFGMLGVLVLGLGAVKFKSFNNGKKSMSILSKEYRNELIKAYNNVFSSFNMKAMESMLTENMHYTTKCTLNVLQKLGVRKKISIKVDPEVEQSFDNSTINIVTTDGKNDMTIYSIPCEYTETYEDTTNDKKIFSKTKKVNYSIDFLKSNQVERDKPTYCINCGTPLNITGDFFDCPNCKSHYNAENYQWTITDVQIIETALEIKVMFAAAITMIVISIVEIFLKNILFGIGIIAVDAFALYWILRYFKFLNDSLNVLKSISANDPNASRMTLFKRVNYLIRNLEMAKDFDITQARAFMTPELYQNLKEVNQYDDYYLVDFNIRNAAFSNYRLEGEYHHVDVMINVERLMMNPKKKIKVKKARKLHYSLMKHKDALTPINATAQTITCSSCGANVNLALNGKCKACGAPIDLAKYDWILSDAPLELTK